MTPFDSNIDPIWQKIDQHTKDIMDIATRAAALEARQKATDDRLDRMITLTAEYRVESRSSMQTIVHKMGDLEKAIHEARGGVRTALWIFSSLMGLIGVGTGVGLAVWRIASGS